MQTAILEDRSVIALTGADARAFLQGLVTADMVECAPGRAVYAALLTPQGKILFEFFVAEETEECFFIDCAATRTADLTKRLGMYKLRAKVVIAPQPELAVAAVWDGTVSAPAGIIPVPDPRLAALGQRLIGPRTELEKISSGADYQGHRLSLGVPDSADLPPDSVFALDAGFEELNGVSFKKGCYVGQEVTSRMKHRASARRRFVIADIDGALPPPGTPLESDGREIGTLATGANGRALALVRLDRLTEAEAAGTPITVKGLTVTLRKPGWFHG